MVTSAFLEMINKSIKEQGVSEMALIIVEHPIAGHNLEGIRKRVDGAFPDILKAGTGNPGLNSLPFSEKNKGMSFRTIIVGRLFGDLGCHRIERKVKGIK